MLYDDNFVISLPKENAFEAIRQVLDVLQTSAPFEVEFQTRSDIENIFEARALVLALADLHNIKFENEDSIPNWRTSTDTEIVSNILKTIRNYCDLKVQSKISEDKKRDFAVLLGGIFGYRLSDADTERIQVLINELRDLIGENERFERDHRRRLLERLEKLQRELHRRLSGLVDKI